MFNLNFIYRGPVFINRDARGVSKVTLMYADCRPLSFKFSLEIYAEEFKNFLAILRVQEVLSIFI